MTIDRWLELGVLAAVQSCILILLVLAIRVPVGRWLGARFAYCLWLTPLLGLAGTAFAAVSALHRPFGLSEISVPASAWVLEVISRAPATAVWAWVFGSTVTILWFTSRSILFAVRLRRRSRDLSFEERTVVRDRCARLARRVDVDFRLLASREGPAVSGFLQPVLMLPVDFFERYSPRQQTLMLSHELQHLCRRDLLVLFLARLYRCLFWINPLAWLAERYVQLDQELSCDERVLAEANRATRRDYGEAMLLALHARLAPDQAGYPGPFAQVRKRAERLPHHRRRLLGSAAGALLLIGLGSGTALFGALSAVDRDQAIRPELRPLLTDSAEVLGSDDSDPEALRRAAEILAREVRMTRNPPLNHRELARIASHQARTWSRLGRIDLAQQAYDRMDDHARGMPELEAQALIGRADLQFAAGNYTEVLKALVRAETVAPEQYRPETWALRGMALARLKLWDQALICFTRAIDLAEAAGARPEERWLLTQAVLRINEGDLEGAARSLDEAIEKHPDTTFENRLRVFSELAEDNWAPQPAEQVAAQD